MRKSSIPVPRNRSSSKSITPSSNKEAGRSIRSLSGRISLAPWRTAGAVATPKVNNTPMCRPTQLDSRLSIRSSVGGPKASKSIPYKETPFKNEAVQDVIGFLISNAYPGSYHKDFNPPPTSKEFVEIFTFIMKTFDPDFKYPTRVDDLPHILKEYGCPIMVTKSTFLNVNSPHTWPSVLAVLGFLVAIASLVNAEPTFEDDRNPAETLWKIKRNPENEQQILDEYRNELRVAHDINFDEMNEKIKIQNELIKENQSLQVENDDLELDGAVAQYNKVKEDEKLLVDYCEKLECHLKKTIFEDNEADKELQSLNEQLEEMHREEKELEAMKSSQKDGDASYYKQKKGDFNKKMEHFEKVKATLESQKWKIEKHRVKLTSARRDLLATLDENYAKVGITDFDSSTDPSAALQQFNSFKKKVIERIEHLSSSFEEVNQEKNRIKKEISLHENEILRLKSKVSRTDDLISFDNAVSEKELKALEGNIERETKSAKNYRDDYLHDQETLHGVQAECRNLERECVSLRKDTEAWMDTQIKEMQKGVADGIEQWSKKISDFEEGVDTVSNEHNKKMERLRENMIKIVAKIKKLTRCDDEKENDQDGQNKK